MNSYVHLSLTEESLLVTDEVWAAFMYNGGAKALQKHEPAISYVVPDEGSNLWVDYLVISSHSRQRELAARFIDFLNRPEVAARNALWGRYATPNTAAEALLPEAFLADPIIYPKQSVLERSEFYQPLSPRVTKSLNAALIRLFN